MWRYLVGAGGALLLVVAGLFLFRGSASTDLKPAIAAHAPAAAPDEEQAPLPDEAPSATERTREEKRFDRVDKDRDSIITRDEYLASRRKAFAKLDVNGDGRLSFDEWAVKTTTRFAGADKDRSNTLTRAEFATTAPKRRAKPKPACRCAPATVSPPPAQAAEGESDD